MALHKAPHNHHLIVPILLKYCLNVCKIADTKLEQNQVAGFLTLLRNMIQTRPTNQDSFVRTNGAAIIGALLQKVSYDNGIPISH